ncbi:alpha/beta fold hydrolase [Streptomyces sp. NPDC007905]|uniref:alpha/beta fold hydrolase n=1 Tax=Streptomyces sp. NPDC007905 TaxID=3364788 RepID=UPI0036ECCDAD
MRSRTPPAPPSTCPTGSPGGARDIRPRTAVDSLAGALPRVRRVVLPDAGHLPRVEDPEGIRKAVAGAL